MKFYTRGGVTASGFSKSQVRIDDTKPDVVIKLFIMDDQPFIRYLEKNLGKDFGTSDLFLSSCFMNVLWRRRDDVYKALKDFGYEEAAS